MIASPTLPYLLWAALEGLERAYADEGAGDLHMPSLDLWANLLRAVDDSGTDPRELPAIVCLSKRAMRSRVSTAVKCGWVEELTFRRGHVMVRLTPRGTSVAARWKSLQVAAEEQWRAKVNVDRASELRVALERVVAALPLEHPHYPASYGAADASITGGNGQDWKPVHRKGGDTISGLPLSALVSQALVAFAMNYEKRSPVALSLSTLVIKRIPAGGLPLEQFGEPVGVSALVRHGFMYVRRNDDNEIAYLTPRGFAVHCAYEERIQAVETEWRGEFGDEPVIALRRALRDVADMASLTRRMPQ